MADILVVDDDENICAAFQLFLTDEGHRPTIVSSGDEAIDKVQDIHPDLVIMDVRMPGTGGLEALERIKSLEPDTYVLIMTAYSSSQTSIDAMKLGAFDYLNKPLDLDDLRDVIRKALEDKALSQKDATQSAADWERYAIVNLIGKAPAMQDAYKTIGVLTTNSVPALLVGEQGTGRSLVAQTIHYNSPRKGEPIVSIDCRSLPEGALEDELFGREAGRQLGVGKTESKLEASNGGTVFLKEIGSMSAPLQARLARYLKGGLFDRDGLTSPIRTDTRIIAATERDLGEDVRDGKFNRDLFDALRVITIHLPPLRQRLDDIPELVGHFLHRSAGELDKDIKGIDDRVTELFKAHSWPGNVSELENVIKRACIMVRGSVITLDEVGESLGEDNLPARGETDAALCQTVRANLHQRLIEGNASGNWSPFHDVVGVVEEALAREAVEVTGGNQVKAAEILGLNRTTLRKKLKVDK